MSYNPAAGPPKVALFSINHSSGTQSTGAIGFTPKFCIYVGAINIDGSNKVATAQGFATGTAGNARSASHADGGASSPQLPGVSVGADPSSIAGYPTPVQNNWIFSGYNVSLDVSAFSSAGIDLTWSSAVSGHQGYLLVVG